MIKWHCEYTRGKIYTDSSERPAFNSLFFIYVYVDIYIAFEKNREDGKSKNDLTSAIFCVYVLKKWFSNDR